MIRLATLRPRPAAVLTAFACCTFFARATGIGSADLPDPRLTPGDVAQRDAAAVCAYGNAARHRKVSYRTRDRVYLAYGIARGRRKGRYEIDHLVPLELGGSNRPANLWPQPLADAKKKDRVEDRLHELVCDGRMSLDAAQRAIERDWHTAVPADER